MEWIYRNTFKIIIQEVDVAEETISSTKVVSSIYCHVLF